jgi:hypothetical protein
LKLIEFHAMTYDCHTQELPVRASFKISAASWQSDLHSISAKRKTRRESAKSNKNIVALSIDKI